MIRVLPLLLALSSGGLVLSLPFVAAAQEQITAQELIELASLDEYQLAALQQGEIVPVDVARLEREQSQLAASLLIWVDAPIDQVRQTLTDDSGLLHEPGTEFEEIRGQDAPYRLVEYTADEAREAERLLNVSPGNKFNLSESEILQFNGSVERESDATQVAGGIYRRIIQARHNAYRNKGLDGIDPYARRKTLTAPRDEFMTALDSFDLLEEFDPQFHAAFREFPDSFEDYVHRFYVRKQQVQKRPAFVLVHWMLHDGGDHLLLAQRQYYVGHTYNTSQTIVGCLPHEGGTLMAVLNQAFTERVSGFASKLARVVGRRRIEQTMVPMFARIKTTVEQ